MARKLHRHCSPSLLHRSCTAVATTGLLISTAKPLADANPELGKANFHQRPLLMVDVVVTLQIGNCTIFASQVILTARLRVNASRSLS